jgi:hypothetical protein
MIFVVFIGAWHLATQPKEAAQAGRRQPSTRS